MKDERGYYYYSRPDDHTSRVYVRRGPGGEIEFRLWHRDYPEVWEKHEWLSRDVLTRAAEMYRETRNGSADPLKIYDLAIARKLLAGESD